MLALVPDGKSNAATNRIDGHLIRATERYAFTGCRDGVGDSFV